MKDLSDPSLKVHLDVNFKLIQYSALAIGTILGIITLLQTLNITFFVLCLILPILLFTASIASGICGIMNIVDENKDKELDWFYNITKAVHNNQLFGSWYLFLFGVVCVEIYVIYLILQYYKFV